MHNPLTADPFRVRNFNQACEILNPIASWLQSRDFFPQTEDEMLEALPLILQKSENEEKEFDKEFEGNSLVTGGKLVEKYSMWNAVYQNLPTKIQQISKSLTHFRRFSLHVDLWLTLNEFVNSKFDWLLIIEDDVVLPSNFLELLQLVIDGLPIDWDFFNFIVPSYETHHYKPYLNIKNSSLSISYQGRPSALLLISKLGAQKVLAEEFQKQNIALDLNSCRSIDTLIHNVSLSHDENLQYYYIDVSDSRQFKTYTFIPEFDSGITWREGFSTLDGSN